LTQKRAKSTAANHGPRDRLSPQRRAHPPRRGEERGRAKLAAVHRDSGAGAEAVAEYEEIVRQNPGYIPARLSLGLALQAAGRQEAAVEQWNAVLELSPGNRRAEMYLKLAEAADRPAT